MTQGRPKNLRECKCVVCGAGFKAKNNLGKYCSRECRLKAHYAQIKNSRYKKHETITKTCPTCDKAFVTRLPQQKYCSRGCYIMGGRQIRFDVANCENCGKPFRKPQGSDKTRCCECSGVYRIVENRGDRVRKRRGSGEMTQRFCTNCGGIVKEHWNNCAYCGNKIERTKDIPEVCYE